MEAEERIKTASQLLLQSPPGEINDVLNGMSPSVLEKFRWAIVVDVRMMIEDDDALQQGILPALKEYNMAQLITVEVPGLNHQVNYSFWQL